MIIACFGLLNEESVWPVLDLQQDGSLVWSLHWALALFLLLMLALVCSCNQGVHGLRIEIHWLGCSACDLMCREPFSFYFPSSCSFFSFLLYFFLCLYHFMCMTGMFPLLSPFLFLLLHFSLLFFLSFPSYLLLFWLISKMFNLNLKFVMQILSAFLNVTFTVFYLKSRSHATQFQDLPYKITVMKTGVGERLDGHLGQWNRTESRNTHKHGQLIFDEDVKVT